MDDPIKQKSMKNDGVVTRSLWPPLVALFATAFGYIVAYSFEFGYLRFFDISYKFIEINIPSLIVSIAFTFFVLSIVDNLSSVYRMFVASFNSPNPIHKLIRTFLRLLVILIAIALAFYATDSREWLSFGFVSGLSLLIIAVEPIPYLIKHKKFDKALKAMYEKRDIRMLNERAKGGETY